MSKKKRKKTIKNGVKKTTKMQRDLLKSTTELNNVVDYFGKVISSIDKNYSALQNRIRKEGKLNDDVDKIFKGMFLTLDKYRQDNFNMVNRIREIRSDIKKTKKDQKLLGVLTAIRELQTNDFMSSMQNDGKFIKSIKSAITKLEEYDIYLNEQQKAKETKSDNIKSVDSKLVELKPADDKLSDEMVKNISEEVVKKINQEQSAQCVGGNEEKSNEKSPDELFNEEAI